MDRATASDPVRRRDGTAVVGERKGNAAPHGERVRPKAQQKQGGFMLDGSQNRSVSFFCCPPRLFDDFAAVPKKKTYTSTTPKHRACA